MIRMNLALMKAQASRPLMWVDRLLSGDVSQHREWRQRLARIERTESLFAERNPRKRALIANPGRWRRIRRFGTAGLVMSLLPTTAFTVFWTWIYVTEHQLGLLPFVLFGLPMLLLPIIARDRFERAGLNAMAATRGSTMGSRRASAAVSGLVRSFLAGFAAGGAVVFIQALLTWFMTPAPTIGQEIVQDLLDAGQWGVITGLVTSVLGLTMAIDPPEPEELTSGAYPELPEVGEEC
ncbi:MAG: hypothetical protein HYV63_18355 [Candidatus Schekmanbacteria bacterium]|nr:hypothetical protein [Candidatus Schekmanbacteria bacterium]